MLKQNKAYRKRRDNILQNFLEQKRIEAAIIDKTYSIPNILFDKLDQLKNYENKMDNKENELIQYKQKLQMKKHFKMENQHLNKTNKQTSKDSKQIQKYFGIKIFIK